MALTAEDIQNVSFSIDRKGYDVDEVDVFLEHVADEVDAMNHLIIDLQDRLDEAQNNAVQVQDDFVVETREVQFDNSEDPEQASRISELEAQVAELEGKLAEKSANDNAISQALIVAQRSADEILANARVEASNIIKDADEEADRIVGKAESDRLKIAEAIRILEADRADVRTEYRDMLSGFMADAQRKLAEIDGDSRRAAAAAQARFDANAAAYAADPVPAPSSYSVPAPMQASTPAPRTSGYVEKDFSGYGDADDDFSFDVE